MGVIGALMVIATKAKKFGHFEIASVTTFPRNDTSLNALPVFNGGG